MPQQNQAKILTAIVLLGAAASGCSSNSFHEPISDFDRAVGTTTQVVAQYEAHAQVEPLYFKLDEAVRSDHDLLLDRTRCRPGGDANACAIEDVQGATWLVGDAPQPAANALAMLLKQYSAGLAKVVDADSGAQLDASADALNNALGNFARKVDPNASSGAFASLDPITTLFKFAVGNYLDARRLQILKIAVARADPLVAQASQQLSAIVADDQTAIISYEATRTQALVATVSAIGQPRSASERAAKRATLTLAVDDAAGVQRLVRVDASASIRALADAHHQLALALRQPHAGVATSFESIESFGQQVRDAYDAIHALH